MKTLILPSGRHINYMLCGEISHTESEVTVSFSSTNCIGDIETISKDDNDIVALLFDVSGSQVYNGYKVFGNLSKNKTGVYTVTMLKDSLVNRNEELEAEIAQLTQLINEQKAVNDQQDMCIVEAFQQICSL